MLHVEKYSNRPFSVFLSSQNVETVCLIQFVCYRRVKKNVGQVRGAADRIPSLPLSPGIKVQKCEFSLKIVNVKKKNIQINLIVSMTIF